MEVQSGQKGVRCSGPNDEPDTLSTAEAALLSNRLAFLRAAPSSSAIGSKSHKSR